MKKKFQGKARLRKVAELMEQADKLVESVRDHFDMEWGENAHTDLDVALSVGVLRHLQEAMSELREIETKYRGRALMPNFPRSPSP